MSPQFSTNDLSDGDSSSSIQCESLLPQEILNYVRVDCLKSRYSLMSVDEAKSAQQQVFVLRFSRRSEEENRQADNTKPTVDGIWSDCLEKGRNRLVVRIWKGGSNWWNLNRNYDPSAIADKEIFGYRMANRAFQACRQLLPSSSPPNIPRVLHYEFPGRKPNTSSSSCWAVLEYVGLHSALFDDENRLLDTAYVDGMIKIRHEFGFDEPHPRWGRVPTEECLAYATLILREVVLPLQENSKRTMAELAGADAGIQDFGAMVQKYQKSLREMSSAAHDADDDATKRDDRMVEVLRVVREAVTRCLPEHLSTGIIPTMAPVLVHLDLQPQNILFYKQKTDDDDDSVTIHVSSVLDWEDASVADPRLEVLLLCRKVCANRTQANTLWSLYQHLSGHRIGPIEPWLQLECIHSIITLLSQSMDLLNGGRNPWESKSDLWGKIQRELHRWNEIKKS